MPPEVAGVTFLAFGNGAPDVFSSLVALTTRTRDKEGALLVGIGSLLGAGERVLVLVCLKSLIAFFRHLLLTLAMYSQHNHEKHNFPSSNQRFQNTPFMRISGRKYLAPCTPLASNFVPSPPPPSSSWFCHWRHCCCYCCWYFRVSWINSALHHYRDRGFSAAHQVHCRSSPPVLPRRAVLDAGFTSRAVVRHREGDLGELHPTLTFWDD